jgi:hypothetical protein
MGHLSTLIEDTVEELTKKQVLLNKIKQPPYSNVIERIEAALPELSLRVSIDRTDLNLQFSGTKLELGQVWSILRSEGFNITDNDRPKENEPSYTNYFYPENYVEDEPQIWLHFTSTVCKRIQTGTKTVEQPIYKVVCE